MAQFIVYWHGHLLKALMLTKVSCPYSSINSLSLWQILAKIVQFIVYWHGHLLKVLMLAKSHFLAHLSILYIYGKFFRKLSNL